MRNPPFFLCKPMIRVFSERSLMCPLDDGVTVLINLLRKSLRRCSMRQSDQLLTLHLISIRLSHERIAKLF